MPNLALLAPQTVISKTFLNRVPNLVYLVFITKTDTGTPSKGTSKAGLSSGKAPEASPTSQRALSPRRWKGTMQGLQYAKPHVTPSSYKCVYLLTTHLICELFEIVIYLKTLNVGKNTLKEFLKPS